ncbi:hypothetical protein G0U57_006154 [Chelydra serpentina]|uniref:Ig-like domain-containing protein n=1 Tax=Chelydra serpentina TaxID=8475 RepID=A0A8T1RYF0_CHESE|nr:hypothetical protein G0U57_006154 [Chelydra serpentina]
MILTLCLLLPALSPSSQEICSAPGALPAPTLYLSQTSAQQGGSVHLQCSVITQASATRIVFCKDGEKISSQRGSEKKVTYGYDHTVSSGSSGNYACGYEIKNSDKRVIKSQLSRAKHLSVTRELGLDLKLLLGITIPAVVILAVVLYLLGKKVAASLPRDQRERVQRDTSNTHEDDIHYASVDWLGSTRDPPPQTEEMLTYADIALQQDRCH